MPWFLVPVVMILAGALLFIGCVLAVLLVIPATRPDDTAEFAVPRTARLHLEAGRYRFYERVEVGAAADRRDPVLHVEADDVLITSAAGGEVDVRDLGRAERAGRADGDHRSRIGFAIETAGEYDVSVSADRPGRAYLGADRTVGMPVQLAVFATAPVGFGIHVLGLVFLVRAAGRRRPRRG